MRSGEAGVEGWTSTGAHNDAKEWELSRNSALQSRGFLPQGWGPLLDPYPLCCRMGEGRPQDLVSLRGSQGPALPTGVWPP